jgi:5-oxoprolinase (ATP-hydrolysing)
MSVGAFADDLPVKIVPRGTSATADAYLTPGIQKYISSFSKGFKGGFQDPHGTVVAFMQSDGTLAGINSFSGLKAILSGPAGGVVGYAKTCYDEVEGSPVIGSVRPQLVIERLSP